MGVRTLNDVFVVCLLVLARGAVGAEPSSKGSVAAGDEIRLLLPEVIYAAPGIETNVYFDDVTLVLNPANYAFDVACDKGAQQAERWTYTPASKDAGSYPLTIEVRDQANRIVARGKSTVCVAPLEAGSGKEITALLIGDSLTHASVYSQQLLDLFARGGNPKLTLVGTHVPKDPSGKNRHEGYGGWTAKRFVTYSTGVARTGKAKEVGSPFLYADGGGKPKLDFARYCKEFNQGKAPDFVTIFLGCNDTFSATDETIEERIDEFLRYMDELIEMVRKVGETTCIGLICPVPPAATQDAFGANYHCGQTRWQYKRNQHRVVERMMAHYAGRAKDRVTLIPAYVNVDCLHNYPKQTAPWNARTSETGARLCNGVHPSAEGYRQIGDSVYAWMKARLAGR
ncbi:MAG: SGNH/GDSL hydrolase family protein [Phycisphaerae bacterium]|nr:SGNH/GDSL hydrolase family protein [Phycisphaerae bacterium]